MTKEQKNALAEINIKAEKLEIDPNLIKILLTKFARGEEPEAGFF